MKALRQVFPLATLTAVFLAPHLGTVEAFPDESHLDSTELYQTSFTASSVHSPQYITQSSLKQAQSTARAPVENYDFDPSFEVPRQVSLFLFKPTRVFHACVIFLANFLMSTGFGAWRGVFYSISHLHVPGAILSVQEMLLFTAGTAALVIHDEWIVLAFAMICVAILVGNVVVYYRLRTRIRWTSKDEACLA